MRDLNLKDRQAVVQSLWTAVNEGGGWLKHAPQSVRAVIETGAWREREVDGRIVKHDRFIDFIKQPPRRGCGWEPEKVEALIKDDPDTLRLWRQAVTPELGVNQHTGIEDNYNIITQQGTSKAYTLDRLQREAPELYDRVLTGELSANAAAIEAGFRKKPTPFEQVQKLLPKLTPTEKRKLKELLK